MRHLLGIALTGILAVSRASADPGQGFTTGLRLGYAIPNGDIMAGASLSGDLTGTVPVQVDLLYRVSSGLAFGGYFAYAQGIPKDCHRLEDLLSPAVYFTALGFWLGVLMGELPRGADRR